MAHNQTQPFTTRELPGTAVGEIKPMEFVDWTLIQRCRDRLDAIILCVNQSGFSYEEVARQLLIDKGNFTRMMQGRANFPDRKSVRLMDICRNYAPMQFEAWACDFELVDKKLLAAIKVRAA